MKNEKTENQEIENLLKSKMNELSESVDCFDKISARAFPKKNQDFSESEFIISDLENVTGKSKKIRTVKLTVIAAAAVFCIAIVPKTGMVQRVFYNIGSSSTKKLYQDLLTEINTEIQSGDYITMDFPLSYYIDNDVLITPLFSCPFDNCGKENLNVRIFVRQIDGIYTNQVYAVEYTETFSEKNIIAAAESEYKFTPDDIEKARQIDITSFSMYNYSDETAERLFGADDDGLFIDNNGDNVSLASFVYPALIKNENDITPVTSEVLYGHKTLSDNEYFYDMISYYDGDIQMPDRKDMWGKSIYYNGNTAMPDENTSHFTMTELFHNDYITTAKYVGCMYVSPFEYDYEPEQNENISIYSGKRLSTIIPPSDTVALTTTKLYFSSFIFSE
ncbi:MAG: hypothetical protein K2H19_05885, partial [Ruminococcus sp.]|nr:hypothetical protein [Ruminococcus sp.]